MPKPFPTAFQKQLQPLPLDQWPAWAKGVARFRKPEDAGVGDTVARMLGTAGVIFQATMKSIGAPCRCPERHKEWNERFRYNLGGDSQSG